MTSRKKSVPDGRMGSSASVNANTHPSGSQINQAAAQRLGFKASNPRMASHGSSSGATPGSTQL